MTASAPTKGIELEIGATGHKSHIVIDGVDVSRHFTRIVVVVDADKPTRISVTGYNFDGGPWIVRGQLVEDPK